MSADAPDHVVQQPEHQVGERLRRGANGGEAAAHRYNIFRLTDVPAIKMPIEDRQR